jgi:AraC-like DNA-binding protein
MFVFQTFGAHAVRTLSFGRKQQPHRYRNEVRDYQQVLVIALTSGALSVESSELRAELGRGELLLLPPHASFTLSTPHRGYQGHYVEGYPAEVSLPPVVRRFRADADLHRTLAQIELELARPFDHALLPALYSTLYIRSLRHAESPRSRHDAAPLLQHVDGILLANRYTDTPLGKLLHGLPVSQRHLSRLYLSERGVTIKQAFLGLKLAEARKLLAETELSVSTIASELGFPSSQHFATRFRQLTGMTPSELRRKP